MIKFKQFLVEIFDSPLPYKWKRKGKKKWIATFDTASDVTYYVIAIIDDEKAIITFGLSEKDKSEDFFELTGTGNEFFVFSTVVEIIREFSVLNQPDSITLIAKTSKRRRLYRSMAKKLVHIINYIVLTDENNVILARKGIV